ncbi:SMI1/KNR4 family protein [Micromonospora sp. ATA51]|uniref:SMI1/KNR4 family protein n=1 Tax=Micromonospora sp. ATA51 TaxID=2806098 RepID=UPI0035CAFD11
MVRQAEETLGFRLPRSYVELMYRQNGGVLKNTCYPTSFRTSWAATTSGWTSSWASDMRRVSTRSRLS